MTLLPPDQARAGRALAQISRDTLGEATGLTVEQIRRFEVFEATITDDENRALRRALEDYGVDFIFDDAVGGYGVRRRFGVTSTQRIEGWEGEGGLAANDDI
ncbi:hypothetical protein [Gulosibacter faecalis]|jgi:hypothetical protein|uniref:XRE family transcriptional regulator n=1 Tax=Gulosibacter faecalis TaxID=272240 RepID=A0ABW5UXG4_9MICO|nr:hypothetical protein [Gulosibacter faecalis]